MNVLFVHQNFPAQFGHIARHLVKERGWTCSFVSQTPPGEVEGIRRIHYSPVGGARARTHYCSRTFENGIAHAHGVFEACKAQPDLQPDLIVGHSGFGSTLFLPELFPGVPIVNYFEYFYHPHGSDMDFRPEFAPAEIDFLRARARNAMILLDLATADRATAPHTSSARCSRPSCGTRSPSSSTASRPTSSDASRTSPGAWAIARSVHRPGS
jgi:hypothetical protein